MLKFNYEMSDTYVNNELYEDMLDAYSMTLMKTIISTIDSIVDGMSYKNFIEDAEDYIRERELPYSKELVYDIATSIYGDFLKLYAHGLVLDADTYTLYISEQIYNFEFGSYTKPALKVIINAVDAAIKELE